MLFKSNGTQHESLIKLSENACGGSLKEHFRWKENVAGVFKKTSVGPGTAREAEDWAEGV